MLRFTERVTDDERARSNALFERASTGAGFSGTILAIDVAVGRAAFELDLGQVGDAMVRVVFLLSVAALGAAATLAVRGAVGARRRQLVDAETIREFAEAAWVTRDAADVKRESIATMATILERDRVNNDRRARLLDIAGLALLVGVLALAGQAALIGIHELRGL
ncbi:MAG TPA: hypothetical protein VF587_16375 [Solirubrobacteraceae bacterium]